MYFEVSNPMDYHAALYIRLSKEDENEGPSESVSNQKSLLEEFVRQHRLPVYGTYIDDGVSGGTFDRPAFNRLVADIERGKINMVITKDLSRLGRDYIMTGHYMERYFPEHHVRYVSLLDGIDTGVDSTANDITPFRAIMNDMYAKDISKKIKSVKRDKQRKGLFIGGKPVFGYKMHPTEKNKIIIDEGAAPTVRRIFALAVQGVSCRQIAARLSAEGVPTPAVYAGLAVKSHGPYAGLWSSERISDMLANETYLGCMVQGRTRKISYKTKKCVKQKPEDWVVVQGTHEPIVSRQEFEQARAMVESRKHTRCRTYDFLLKGLIRCRECGYPLAVINRKKRGGQDCLYFVCRTYQRFTKAGACTCHSVKEKSVTEAVAEQVRAICEAYVNRSGLLSMAERALRENERAQRRQQEADELTEKIKSYSAQLDRIYLDKLNGVLCEEDFFRIYEKQKAERAALEQRLEMLRRRAERPQNGEQTAEGLVERFLAAAGQNRELLVNLVERIEYSEDKSLTMRFKFPHP